MKEKDQQDWQYGRMVRNIDFGGPTISPDDFSRHMYIVGASGCGKTTFIRQLAKHLECANLNDTFPNSFIYIDVKDEDSKIFLRQVEQATIENGDAIFFIEKIKKKDGSIGFQLQYSQMVLLNFNGLSWPHVSVATLTRQ